MLTACSLVLTTSNGVTATADNEPEAQPEKNDTKNAASLDPSFLRGPNWLSVANNGKYTMENETSRIIVALIPLYKPMMPFSRSNESAKPVADTFGTVLPSNLAWL